MKTIKEELQQMRTDVAHGAVMIAASLGVLIMCALAFARATG